MLERPDAESPPLPDAAYTLREPDALKIASEGYVPALQDAEQTGCVALWLHTHPGIGASPSPSRLDQIVDRQLSDLFRLRTSSELYGSVIVAHDQGQIIFSGFLENAAGRWPIDYLWIVGDRFRLVSNVDTTATSPLPHEFDRNIRAFGGDVQQVLQRLHIAVVGCGGTGSAVAEQLIRLGVRRLTLVDPDTLSLSNVTRVYGSTLATVGQPKVSVLRDHLRRIVDGLSITCAPTMVTVEHAARQLTDADVVFGCTDDNAGRVVLSRLSTYFLLPVIDCGVLLESATGGRLSGIHGRVTVLHPEAACLLCRGRIDLDRARTELFTPSERTRLEHEGYAPALGAVEPAVVVYTTMVAAAAVGELLERLIHYGPEDRPSEILLRIHDREVSTNNALPKPRHYCHSTSGKRGAGFTSPFLDLTWQA
ncbi:MAG: ThiF family adenylyltransferase [Planctomycetes bacterium]|nr:ThiF family adenylyltransferase [Planctomycetota bacterium]